MNTTASGPTAALAATHVAFSSSYTPLETLLLFQSVLKYGIGTDAFSRIASVLQENALIRGDASYDASRLSAESLQTLFIDLLHDETIAQAGGGGGGSSSHHDNPAQSQQRQHPLSPTSSATVLPKKRKLSNNTNTFLPALHDALARADQLPVLIDHLYARYRDDAVGSIRDYETRYASVRADIQELEREVEEAEEAERKSEQRHALDRQHGATAMPVTAPSPDKKEALLAPGPAVGALSGSPSDENDSAYQPTTPRLSAGATATQLPGSAPRANSPSGPVARGNPLLPTTSRPATHLTAEIQRNEPRSGLSSLLPSSATAPSLAVPGTSSILPRMPAVQTDSLESAPGTPAVLPVSGQAQVLRQTSTTQLGRPGLPAQSQTDQLATSTEPEQNSEPARLNVVHPVPATGPGAPTPNASREQIPSSASLPALPRSSQALASIQAEAATADSRPESQRTVQPIANKPPIATFSTTSSSHMLTGKWGAVPRSPASQAAVGVSTATAPIASSRPLLPAGIQAPPSRTPTPVQSPLPVLPHTPAQTTGFIPRGSGTRWKPNERITSTPGLGIDDIASPAYEPLSPIQPGASSRTAPVDGAGGFSTSPSASGNNLRQPWHTRKSQFATRSRQRADPASTRPRGGRPTRHGRLHSETDDGSFAVKHEELTATAVGGITEMTMDNDDLDGSVAVSPSSRLLKRKRDESVDFASPSDGGLDRKQYLLARRRLVGPPTPPTHVLWTRGFPRISASALDQISSHRHANMFAHKIRDRDAPGYGSIVRHPVDLKSIRIAITQGNKAAMAMAATLPESDQQSASSLWLPISEDLVPPRGIINSSQLECELMHMFANAVMYNPDSHRGPGPTFMTSHEVADDDAAGMAGGLDGSVGGGGYGRYKVDEDGVVNDTRDMYVEVEKLLSEMRSAEKQRGAPPPPADARGLDLPIDDTDLVGLSAADFREGGGKEAEENLPGSSGPSGSFVRREDEAAEDTATDGAGPGADAEESSTSKRRRITRGQ